jgi:glycosyltransferase involved in cell wall biosynthesis
MRICVIAPTALFIDRGTPIRIFEELQALAEQGHKIDLVTYHVGQPLPLSPSAAPNVNVYRIPPFFFWYQKTDAGIYWTKLFLDLLMLITATWVVLRTKPDVLHTHLHEGVLIGWTVRGLLFWRRLRQVADLHSSLTQEMKTHGALRSSLLLRMAAQFEWEIERCADAIVTSSAEYANTLRTTKHTQAQFDITPVVDGVNTGVYASLPDRAALRAQFGLSSDTVLVGYVGGFQRNKGIEDIVQAVVALRSTPQASHVHVVFAGSPREKLEPLLKEAGIENEVSVISPLPYDTLPFVLGALDIAIDPKDPSTGQASGKIVQYMAAGLPIICTDRQTNRDYVQDGALYYEAHNTQALVNAITQLADDAVLRQRLGEQNRTHAQQFSWRRVGEQLEQIYSSLIA